MNHRPSPIASDAIRIRSTFQLSMMCRKPQIAREILRAEQQRDHAIRGRSDRMRLEKSPGRLDRGHDANGPAPHPSRLFAFVKIAAQPSDLSGIVDLGCDDPIEPRPQDRGKIRVACRGFAVDSHVARGTVPGGWKSEHRCDRRASAILLVGRHAVLEVEDRDVEGCGRELAQTEGALHHPRPVSRHEHQRAQEVHQ